MDLVALCKQTADQIAQDSIMNFMNANDVANSL